MDADSSLLYDRLEAVVSETLTSTEWTLTEVSDGYQISLSKRAVTITPHKGPTGTPNWVLTLLADGKTVGKFGPFDRIESLAEQVSTVLESKTWYTVCCDGSPE